MLLCDAQFYRRPGDKDKKPRKSKGSVKKILGTGAVAAMGTGTALGTIGEGLKYEPLKAGSKVIRKAIKKWTPAAIIGTGLYASGKQAVKTLKSKRNR